MNNRLAVLRKCLTTAVEWDVLKTVPRFRQLRAAPPAFRFLEEHEVAKIISACATDMECALVFVAVRTGLRFSELSALEWQDVDFGRRTVTIRHANVGGHIGTPKNGRICYVPLTNDVIDKLKSLNHESDLVFHRNGKHLIYWPSFCFLQRACKTSEHRTNRLAHASTYVRVASGVQRCVHAGNQGSAWLFDAHDDASLRASGTRDAAIRSSCSSPIKRRKFGQLVVNATFHQSRSTSKYFSQPRSIHRSTIQKSRSRRETFCSFFGGGERGIRTLAGLLTP